MSKNERAEARTRHDTSRNEPASQHRGIAGDARTSEQAREQGTKETKSRTTPRKRRPPFVL